MEPVPVVKGIDRLLGRLPAFSPIAVRLLATLADDGASFKEIARLITLDPVLAGEVLQLANSGLYGRRVEVHSVLHAIAMLGCAKLSQIAVTAALWRGLPRRPHPFVREWWRHSIAAALIAKQTRDGVTPDIAYTAALLHGVGQLALFEDSPRDYPDMLERSYKDRIDLLALETDVFGVDHAVLAGLLLDSWGLPKELCAAVTTHHDAGTVTPLDRAIKAGCVGAEQAGFGQCGCPERDSELLAEHQAGDHTFDTLIAEINQIECTLT